MFHSATDAVADRFTVIDDRADYSSNQPTTSASPSPVTVLAARYRHSPPPAKPIGLLSSTIAQAIHLFNRQCGGRRRPPQITLRQSLCAARLPTNSGRFDCYNFTVPARLSNLAAITFIHFHSVAVADRKRRTTAVVVVVVVVFFQYNQSWTSVPSIVLS